MLKKTIWIAAVFVFGFGVLGTSVYRTTLAQTVATPTLAEDNENGSEAVLGGGAGQTISPEMVDYDLAWPGLLPDHFLYPFKMIRDKIWLFLTSGSLKKAELLLKFADKRILAAQILVDKGKAELGVTTATKAVKYLQEAVAQERMAKKEGQETTAFLEKLSRAVLKHEEVLTTIRQKVSTEIKPAVDNSLMMVQKSYEEIKERQAE